MGVHMLNMSHTWRSEKQSVGISFLLLPFQTLWDGAKVMFKGTECL